MKLESQIFIYFANCFDFKTEEGNDVKGTKIYYLDSIDMSPVNEIDTKHSKGRRSNNAMLDYGMLSKMPYVPGIYDASFETTTDAKGNLTLKVVDIKPSSSCNLLPTKATK